jgi:type I restriction-modification system DNA methylase subunit
VIPQFGGELFAPDQVLDVLTIDDAVLKNDLLVLSKYDFNTDVDVNILGHIFEHSLNEVDDVEASLRGETPDKTKSKRKKDGVFYTPKYITKYIVDNTLGKLCAEKKAECKLDGDIAIFEYQKADGKLNEKGKDLYERLNAYKAWLLTVKVCDPACGSGAFLNQALSFFIDEHRFIDDLVAELTNTPLRLFDTDLQILENNIYGVDINEESVEIAKLSLWLRTAQPGRKLSDLSANIKCGNSLIDDPAVAGDKAFNWQQEFPAVFEKGGFDVVIGNPPYGMVSDNDQKIFYKSKFNLIEGRYDLYELFIEMSLNLFNKKGSLSFIIPNTILSNLYSKGLRKYIASNLRIIEIVNFGMDVFDDPTVHTCILTLSSKMSNNFVCIRKQIEQQNQLDYEYDYLVPQSEFLSSKNNTYDIFFNPKEKSLMNKINTGIPLSEICYIRQCIKTGNDPVYVINSKNNLGEPWKPVLRGKGINRYAIIEKDLYLKYGDWLARNWKNKTFYETSKIIVRETGNRITAALDFESNYLLSSLYSIYPKKKSSLSSLKALIAILNSRLATFYIMKIAFELTKGAFTKCSN